MRKAHSIHVPQTIQRSPLVSPSEVCSIQRCLFQTLATCLPFPSGFNQKARTLAQLEDGPSTRWWRFARGRVTNRLRLACSPTKDRVLVLRPKHRTTGSVGGIARVGTVVTVSPPACDSLRGFTSWL